MPELITCVRCKTDHTEVYCPECGVHRNRVVRRIRARGHRPRKRGRNSGKVGTSKNKG